MTTTKKKGLSERETKLIKQLLNELIEHIESPGVNAGFGFFKAVDYDKKLEQLSIKDAFLEVWKFIDILVRDKASLMQLVQVRRGDLKTLISWVQLTLFAIESRENPKQLENLSPNSRLLVEQYYPNNENMPDLKTKMFDCYYYMAYYNICKNVILGLRKLTGLNRECGKLARLAGIVQASFSPRGLTFAETYSYYEKSSKNIETDFGFLIACLKELKAKMPKGIKNSIPIFETARFKPKDENIDQCVNEILSNKTNFIACYELGKVKETTDEIERELVKFERFEMGYY